MRPYCPYCGTVIVKRTGIMGDWDVWICRALDCGERWWGILTGDRWKIRVPVRDVPFGPYLTEYEQANIYAPMLMQSLMNRSD